MKPTGFNTWTPPDIPWMLRMIIFLDPTKRKAVFEYKKSKDSKKRFRVRRDLGR